MNDPVRWMKDDGAPREVGEVLEAMSPPRPASGLVHQRLAARFADAGAARVRLAGSLGAKIARLAAGVAIGGGVVFAAVRGPLPRKAPAAVPMPAVPRTPATSERSAVPEAPVAEREIAELLPQNPAAEPSGPSIHGAASARHSNPSTDTLAEEETILEGARRALATSPAQALRLLGIHQRRFPAGELTAERLFLRADALRRLGRSAEARRQADALIKRFPTSAYARLVPELVGSEPSP